MEENLIVTGDWNYTADEIDRDNLELHRINENGTIGEMIDTINANFQNLAKHGGGPAGLDGLNGLDGLDGTNVEYIYALSDVMEPDVHYPSNQEGMAELFERVHFSEQVGFPENDPNVTWYEHAQSISEEHKNEFVLIRYKIAGLWAYAEKPVLWAHWGENGHDGDGVEYIFLTSNHEFSESELNSLILKKVNMDKYQKVLFQIDDFYPGRGWFVDSNRSVAKKALDDAGLSLIQSAFNEQWRNYFNFFSDYSWTDEPIGTSPLIPFEYVAIRRSKTDENGIRTWDDYSKPSIWSNYGLPSRTFIIYYNADEGVRPEKPTGGWWDTDMDKLLFEKHFPDGSVVKLLPVGWKDTDIDQEGKIVWMSSGIFAYSGENLSWTEPIRVSGKDGEKGEDGALIEFIYTLSDTMVKGTNYPANKNEWGKIFDTLENPDNPAEGITVRQDRNDIKYVDYNGTHWYDRALSISPSNKVEYVWIRTRNPRTMDDSDYNNWEWVYTEPTLWARWGEDGTDGDGVEYIFHTSTVKYNETSQDSFKRCPTLAEMDNLESQTLAKYCKLVYNTKDFYPNETWFTEENIQKVRDVISQDSTLSIQDFNNKLNDIKSFFNQGWTDSPTGTDMTNLYEYVSIRKSTTIKTDDDVSITTWGDFSKPALWSNYNNKSRVFIVYCNTDAEDDKPEKPEGGVWNIRTDKFIANDSQHPLSEGWSDTDVEEEGKITWMSSGIFHEDDYTSPDKTPQWSEPHRITGADGVKGADGSNIEFIYALFNVNQMLENMHYPSPGANNKNWKTLFDAAEDSSTVEQQDLTNAGLSLGQNGDVIFGEVHWYDRALAISEENKIEFCWSRYKSVGNDTWEYDPEPFIWARWGEDGTDGDGIEYIFTLMEKESEFTNWATNVDIAGLDPIQRLIYSVNDFVPNSAWFSEQNKTKVRTKLENDGNVFIDSDYTNAWDSLKTKFSFDIKELGEWSDNPIGITPIKPYEYVSVRKSPEGVWSAFSEPKLWTKYNLNKFTSFVFAATKPDVDLSGCTLTGGDYDNPLPTETKLGNTRINDIVWTDNPQPNPDNGKTEIWMSSANLYEGYVPDTEHNEVYPVWSTPKRMADSLELNIEWSADDVTVTRINEINNSINNSSYNFGTFMSQNNFDESAAEEAWRQKMSNDFNITFSDTAINAILMATCQMKNGEWTNWTITRVKGEKGDKGSSINVRGKIQYEVNLDPNVSYTYENANSARRNAVLNDQPHDGDLLIVFPNEANENNVYYGDATMGGALYMWKYVEANDTWIDYNNRDSSNPNNEELNNCYTSPTGHLILWDGDSWQDLGILHGPEGPECKVLVRFANDDPNDPSKKIFVTGDDIPKAKWIGILTYTEGEEDPSDFTETHERWIWSLFKGQDGYGLEFIYKATETNEPPRVPQTEEIEDLTANVVPQDWEDEPIEPTQEVKYVWMCWRKYDTSLNTPRWTKFMGKDSKTYDQNGVARLWQVYANSIIEVDEYFHADESISPVFPATGDVEELPEGWNNFWHSKSQVVGNNAIAGYKWDKTNRYLFNIEIVKYADGSMKILDPHYISVFADGIIDIVDYYILDTDGSDAPHITNGVPVTSGSNDNEGTAWWTKNVSATKISADYPYLWNISEKTYEDGNKDWTTPMVIGVFGFGEEKVYLDMDNEMDVVQIDTNNFVLDSYTFTAYIHMYSGSDMIGMKKLEMSGEDRFGNNLQIHRSVDNSNPSWISVSDGNTFGSSKVIRMTLSLNNGYRLTDEYSKIQFTITSENDDVRTVSYTLVGTTNPTQYKIQLNSGVIVKKKSGLCDPSQLTVTVVKMASGESTTYTSNQTGEGGFVLYCNGDVCNNYTIDTSNAQVGNKYIFSLYVDTDDANTNPDTVMDMETVYVIGDGQEYIDDWLHILLNSDTDISGALVMTGDLLARNRYNEVVAGIIGHDYNQNTNTNVRFFAGNTGISKISEDTKDAFIAAVESRPFRVTEGGKLYATDAVISGVITATELNIGNFNLADSTSAASWVNQYSDDSWLLSAFSKTKIKGGLIETGNLLAKNSNGSITAGVMGYDTSVASDVRFFAGTSISFDSNTDTSDTSANGFISKIKNTATFRVDEDGSLYASKADITGIVTASQLNINGYNIATSDGLANFLSAAGIEDNNYDWITAALSSTSIIGGLIQTGNILVKDGENKVTAGVMGYNSTASDDIRFFAGNVSMNASTDTSSSSFISSIKQNAPFYVTESGELHATNANISGTITAISGSIGGITITSNAISSTNGNFYVTNAGELHSTSGSIGGINITSNAISSTNGSFYVTSAGSLVATDASISGKITATELHIGDYDLTNSSQASNWINNFVSSGSNYEWIKNAFSETNIIGGLIQTGNILATDGSGNITAGVMGYNSGSDDVRFFAGTNLSYSTSTNTSGTSFISDIKRDATFRVDEDGTMYAKKGVFSGYVQMPYKSPLGDNFATTSVSGTGEQGFVAGSNAYIVITPSDWNAHRWIILPTPSASLNGFTYNIIILPYYISKMDANNEVLMFATEDYSRNSENYHFRCLSYSEYNLAHTPFKTFSSVGGAITLTCIRYSSSEYCWMITNCTGNFIAFSGARSDLPLGTYANMFGYSAITSRADVALKRAISKIVTDDGYTTSNTDTIVIRRSNS